VEIQMLWNQFARVVITFALLCLPMAAQQPQDAPTHVTLQGVVQTPDKTPVPGKFHIDAAQIGFGSAGVDVAPTTEKSDDIIMVLKIASAAEITAANEASAAANAATTAAVAPAAPGTTPPATADAAKNQTTTPPPANGTIPPAGANSTGTTTTKPTQTARGGARGQNNQNAGGRGNTGGGFNRVDVNGAGANAETTDTT
jgi:hypothetical protein